MKEQNRTLLVEIQNQKVMNLCERLNHQRRCGLLEQEIHRLREKYEGGDGREEDRLVKIQMHGVFFTRGQFLE